MIPLQELANALREHIVLGTMNIDLINSYLHPTACISMIVHPSNPTSVPLTPAEDNTSRRVESDLDANAQIASQPTSTLQQSMDQPNAQHSSVGNLQSGRRTGKAKISVPAFADKSGGTRTNLGVLATVSSRKKRRSSEVTSEINQPASMQPQPGDSAVLQNQLPKKRGGHDGPNNGTSKQQKTSEMDLAGGHARSEDQEAAKDAFVHKWSSRLRGISEWDGLERYIFIGTKSGQLPYQALGQMIEQIQPFGTSKVQQAFAQDVRSWLSSGRYREMHLLPPEQLQHIPTCCNPLPFQHFWKAMKILSIAKGGESMASVLRRKAFVDGVTTYKEACQEIRSKVKEGAIMLRQNQSAAAQIREQFFGTFYRDKARLQQAQSIFAHVQHCATPYIRMIEHYGNDGILALVPPEIAETELCNKARVDALPGILDMVHPDFNDARLLCYADVINTMAEGLAPDDDVLAEMDRWVMEVE